MYSRKFKLRKLLGASFFTISRNKIPTKVSTHTVHCMYIYFYIPAHLSGDVARQELMKSKLPNSVLRRIWALADIDEDGMLDRDEFAVAMFLIDHKLAGNDLPETLPDQVPN